MSGKIFGYYIQCELFIVFFPRDKLVSDKWWQKKQATHFMSRKKDDPCFFFEGIFSEWSLWLVGVPTITPVPVPAFKGPKKKKWLGKT